MQRDYEPTGAEIWDNVHTIVPRVDLIQGRAHSGRVTAWAARCNMCDGLVCAPTSKARAAEAVRAHYADHRAGKV